jgi:hypothetical protein
MAFSGSTVHHRNQKGEVVYYNAAGYCCRYGQNLGGSKCQQRYISAKIDDVVRDVIQQIFKRIRETPPTDCLDRQHEHTLSEIKGKIKTANGSISKLNKELSAYRNEVIKVIQGSSGFTAEILNQLILDCEGKISEHAAGAELLQSELDNNDSLYEKTKKEHGQIRSWSEIFNESSLETQKMVAASLISAVRVSRGYRMEIDLNISAKEFVEGISFNNEMLSVTVGN